MVLELEMWDPQVSIVAEKYISMIIHDLDLGVPLWMGKLQKYTCPLILVGGFNPSEKY